MKMKDIYSKEEEQEKEKEKEKEDQTKKMIKKYDFHTIAFV